MADLERIRARAAAATPGPWQWFDDRLGAYLATPDRGRLHVLRCFRRGTLGAEPRFRDGGVMAAGVDHPDAEFIAHARQDVEDLLALVDTLIGERPPYHVLEVGDGDWSVQHEASCFPNLLACPIHRLHRTLDEQGVERPPPGRYRLTASGLIATGADGYAVEVDADG